MKQWLKSGVAPPWKNAFSLVANKKKRKKALATSMSTLIYIFQVFLSIKVSLQDYVRRYEHVDKRGVGKSTRTLYQVISVLLIQRRKSNYVIKCDSDLQ